MAIDLQKLRQNTDDKTIMESLYGQDKGFQDFTDHMLNNREMNSFDARKVPTMLLDSYYNRGKKQPEVNYEDIAASAQEAYDTKETFKQDTLSGVIGSASQGILDTAAGLFGKVMEKGKGFFTDTNALGRLKTSFADPENRAKADESQNKPGFDLGDIASVAPEIMSAGMIGVGAGVGGILSGGIGAIPGAGAGAALR